MRKNSRLLVLSFLIPILFGNAATAQTKSERVHRIEAALPVVDNIFKDFAAQNHFPGFVYGIIADGYLIHTGNIGYTDLEKKTLADIHSGFRIASMTKSFTALAILKLRDEGKIHLDDPVSMYIQEMKDQKYLSSDAPEITIRHLMTHSAGFPEDNPWGDRQLAISDEEMLEMIRKGISFSNIPGIVYEYSNLGFAMLGYIIRIVTGLPYETYITSNILEPLKMNNTYWEYSNVPAAKLAHGYRWASTNWQEEALLHHGAYGAMGGLISSIEDFTKYMNFHLSAWPPRNDEETGPVKRSSVREMHFPQNISYLSPNFRYPGGRECPSVSAYGFGLNWTKDCEGRVMIGHGGGLPGFGSHWRIMPDYGIGIVSFTNVTYAPAGYINLMILDTLINMADLSPLQLPVSPVLDQRKNELIQILPEWKNPEEANIFAVNFFLDYSLSSLRNKSKAIFKKAGKIINIRPIIPENNLRGSFLIEGENCNIEIYFTLSPEKRPLIQEFSIVELPKN
jgi:CubicO group peptidase (beta-lactamase class C family)